MLYSAMCNGASIYKYKAYELSLINGCGTHENIICGILSFEVALGSSPKIIIAKKVTSKCKEKFVILQSIRIIAIKK